MGTDFTADTKSTFVATLKGSGDPGIFFGGGPCKPSEEKFFAFFNAAGENFCIFYCRRRKIIHIIAVRFFFEG
jgi:hypothetical protein